MPQDTRPSLVQILACCLFAIIWTNAGVLSTGPLGIIFSEISIKFLNTFGQKNAYECDFWKMLAILSRRQCASWKRTRITHVFRVANNLELKHYNSFEVGLAHVTRCHDFARPTSFHDDVIKWKYFPHHWLFVRGNSSHKWVTWSFDVFFDLRLKKGLSKQSRRRWF